MEAALVCFKYFLMKESSVKGAQGDNSGETLVSQLCTPAQFCREEGGRPAAFAGERTGMCREASAGPLLASVLDAQILGLHYHLECIHQAADPPCISRQMQELENILAKAKARQAYRGTFPGLNDSTESENATAASGPSAGHLGASGASGCMSTGGGAIYASALQSTVHCLTNVEEGFRDAAPMCAPDGVVELQADFGYSTEKVPVANV